MSFSIGQHRYVKTLRKTQQQAPFSCDASHELCSIFYYFLQEDPPAGDALICRHILSLHGNAERVGGGDMLMSRRRSLAKPLVGPWDETMAGREWAASPVLCALCVCLSVCFSPTHTHGVNWTVCKKAVRTMKTKNRMPGRIYLSRRNDLSTYTSCN